jgi:hypothetical protein
MSKLKHVCFISYKVNGVKYKRECPNFSRIATKDMRDGSRNVAMYDIDYVKDNNEFIFTDPEK